MDFSRRFDMAAGALVFLVFLATVYLTKDFLTTILLSIVMVFLLKPLYAAFFRLTRQRQISSFFSILIVFIFILAILLGITTVLLVEISNLEKSGALSGIQFTAITQEIDIWAMSALPAWIYNYVNVIILKNVQEISDIPVTIATWLFPIVQRELTSFASNLPVLFAQLIVVVFFTYYILIDGKEFMAKAVDLIPRQKRGIVLNFLQELNSIYTTLFTVYFTTSMLSGVLAAIGFSMLGVPYPYCDGGSCGHLYSHPHARAAFRIHSHGALLSVHGGHDPFPDNHGIRNGGAHGDTREHNPPPSGHEERKDSSHSHIARLHRPHIRGGDHRRDYRPDTLRFSPGGLPGGYQ